MAMCEIEFGPLPPRDREWAEDLAGSYLSRLCNNGQIGRYWCSFPRNGRLVAVVDAISTRAHEGRFHSPVGLQDLESIVGAFGCEPRWKVMEDDAPRRDTLWGGAPWLVLKAPHSGIGSPLRRGDTGAGIPLCRVPIEPKQREEIAFWQKGFDDLDSVWINSGALERAAWRELADVRREPAREGMESCRAIEAALGIPVYYFLPRYYGRREGVDPDLRCPGCGGEWLAEGSCPKLSIHYLCKRCRLASERAVEKNAAWAAIGAWKG